MRFMGGLIKIDKEFSEIMMKFLENYGIVIEQTTDINKIKNAKNLVATIKPSCKKLIIK